MNDRNGNGKFDSWHNFTQTSKGIANLRKAYALSGLIFN
jgi:hypothetical protein